MLTSVVVRCVAFCRRFAGGVALVGLVGSLGLGWYAAGHFRINTDINQLLAADLEWRQREVALEQAFPQKVDQLVVVVDGADADGTEEAVEALASKMRDRADLFKNVTRPDALPFFRKNGLLFLSDDALNGVLERLVQAQPLLGTMARDPSLRGLLDAMGLMAEGIKRGEADAAQTEVPFTRLAETIETVLAGQDKPLAWRSLMAGGAPLPRDLRKYILAQPVLDYGALAPGAAASAAVRAMAQGLNLTPEHGVRVRLTGSVALNDEEFASVANGTQTATIVAGVLVFVILFLALRSFRLIVPILLTLAAGLVATTAFAMAVIGSLNLISVAFAVMFVGIAVDFGIQFGVRYRDQRHREPDDGKALLATAGIIAVPLALAAGATSLGFLAFIPTDYRGVAELGAIAGAGMLIAFALNVTLLPALLTLFRPLAEPEAVGYAWAAPVDRFLAAHRKKVLVAAGILAVVGAGVATQVRFDFDPLNLKDARTESVSTLFDIMKDPEATPYTIEILEPSLDEAQKVADKIAALPEVDHAMTFASFVPDDQDKKLGFISDAKFLLDPVLNPSEVTAPPTDKETVAAMEKTAGALRDLGAERKAAQHLAAALDAVVARQDHLLLQPLQVALVQGLVEQLAAVRESLTGERVTVESITDDVRRDWVTPDGRAKIAVYPKGDARDHDVLEAFTAAVKTVSSEASGAPVSIQESGWTVETAFVKAGAFGILAIAGLVWAVLRRGSDVLRLLAPLVLAGILTLATMALLGLSLNFANIIALPLLLSLGVSYAIYFISYWRAGMKNPLQSSMARSVLFSAATTLVAFGSLSLSSHPGTSGMGELLTIALLYCLVCTFFVFPALLGDHKSC